MNHLEDYNNLKELLQQSSSPANSTQLETFKWLHSVWLEKAEKVLEGLQEFYTYGHRRPVAFNLGLSDDGGYSLAKEIENFPDTFKKDKQELYKKLLSFE